MLLAVCMAPPHSIRDKHCSGGGENQADILLWKGLFGCICSARERVGGGLGGEDLRCTLDFP